MITNRLAWRSTLLVGRRCHLRILVKSPLLCWMKLMIAKKEESTRNVGDV